MIKLVLYESTGQWASALRRVLAQGVEMIETRRWDELRRELKQASAAIVGIEIDIDRAETSLAAIDAIAGEFPGTVIVALADRRLARCDSLFREAGAAHVVFSPRQVGEIAAIANRRLAAEPDNDFNAQELSWEEQIAARMPWGERATDVGVSG